MEAIYIKQPHQIGVINKEEPSTKENESLIRVLGCGVCGRI